MFRARRLLVAGLSTMLACSALAQGVTTPVLRGVMGKGKQAITLWELPGESGNAPVGIGAVVPGTPWRVAGVKPPNGEVWVYVDRKTPVLFWQGATYLSGTRATTAPEVARPENRPVGEYNPPTPEQEAYNRQRAAALSRGAAPASNPVQVGQSVLRDGESYRVTNGDYARLRPIRDSIVSENAALEARRSAVDPRYIDQVNAYNEAASRIKERAQSFSQDLNRVGTPTR